MERNAYWDYVLSFWNVSEDELATRFGIDRAYIKEVRAEEELQEKEKLEERKKETDAQDNILIDYMRLFGDNTNKKLVAIIDRLRDELERKL